MDKKSFYEILKTITPDELNELISSKGKKKMVNGVTFIKDKENINNDTDESDHIEMEK